MTPPSSVGAVRLGRSERTVPPRPTPATRRFLLSRTFLPVWLVFGAVTAAAALGVSFPTRIGVALLLGSVVILGLPHGAVDHLFVGRLATGGRERGDSERAESGLTSERAESGVIRGGDASERGLRAASRRLRRSAAARPLLAVGAVYALLGGAYVIGWATAPAAAFVGFLLLTWVHWGLADLYGLVAIGGGDHLRSRAQRALAACVRGALPMLVPLVAHPAEYRAVATVVVGTFEPAAAATLAPVFAPGVRTAVGVALGVGVVGTLALGAARADRLDRWALDAGETLLLVAFFAVVPPVAAIGLYFPLWHSLRHVVRIELLDPPAVEGFRNGRLTPGLGRFARDAAPLTAGALVVFGGLFVVAPGASTDPEGLVGLYLVLLAVLTLPHAAVAAWGDFRQGLWNV